MSTRPVKELLMSFCDKWNATVSKATETRGDVSGDIQALSHRKFNIQVGNKIAYALVFTPTGAKLENKADPFAHASLKLSGQDWIQLLKGETNIISLLIASRLYINRDEALIIEVLGNVLQRFALRKNTNGWEGKND